MTNTFIVDGINDHTEFSELFRGGYFVGLNLDRESWDKLTRILAIMRDELHFVDDKSILSPGDKKRVLQVANTQLQRYKCSRYGIQSAFDRAIGDLIMSGASGGTPVYPIKLKNWDLGLAKASGFERSKLASYCNMGRVLIVESRELSLKPKTNSST